MEISSNQLFINSEKVGDTVQIRLPGFDQKGEETFVHYLESGVGEPLLLIHGIGQSLYTWRNVFGELSENYRVIAIDLPGHGYSGRPESFNYSMDSMAEWIRLFMDAKGIESAHMIGFSTGAMYMFRFLSLYEKRVANCIAICPGGITDRMPPLIHKIGRPLRSVFARNLFTAKDVRELLYECVYDEELVDEKMVRQYYQPLSDGLSREALMYAIRNFDMDTVAEGIIELDHEVLVLWGKEDEWHPPVGSMYFQNVLRKGRYYLVKHTGHLIQEENPEKLLEVVLSYVPPVRSDAVLQGFGNLRGYSMPYEEAPDEGTPLHADPSAYDGETLARPVEGFSREGLPHFGEEDPGEENGDDAPSREDPPEEAAPEQEGDASGEDAGDGADDWETCAEETASDDPPEKADE